MFNYFTIAVFQSNTMPPEIGDLSTSKPSKLKYDENLKGSVYTAQSSWL